MPELHFLRPWWLAAVPLVPLLVWRLRRYLDAGERWRSVCDAHLLPHLLVGHSTRDARWAFRLMAAALVLTCVALSGPAWRRVELPVYRAPVARVVVLDLSRSMDAPDLPPSRLERARFKVADILRRDTAELTGLVVFAGDAFVVSPLTQDAETLVAMLPALETSIMPVQGSRVDRGLQEAARLLHQGQASRGEVILVTDAGEDPRAPGAAAQLAEAGFPVSVLATGTAQGAPIPLPTGNFLKDEDGSIVVPSLSLDALGAIARAGRGRLVTISADDRDLDLLLAADSWIPWENEALATERSTELWRDDGPWLLVLVLPIAALAFRRGWLLGIVAVGLLQPPTAQALEWADLWWRADQRTARALARGLPEAASDLAPDSAWRGSAQYRAERYDDAARSFAEGSDPDSNYNRGNALARAGKLEAAIAAYDVALEGHPSMEDALFNRHLIEQLLRQQQSRARGQGEGEASRQPAANDEGGADDEPRGRRDEDGGERDTGNEAAREGADGSNQADGATAERAPEQPPQDSTQSREQPEQERAETRSEAVAQRWQQEPDEERRQALEQWLRRIPDDPGGLLRRKFALEYQRRVRLEGELTQPW